MQTDGGSNGTKQSGATVLKALRRSLELIMAALKALRRFLELLDAALKAIGRALITPALFIGAILFAFVSATILVPLDQPEPRLSVEGMFIFSMATNLIAHLCMGAFLFREKEILLRVLGASMFVLYIYPLLFALSFFRNACFPEANSFTQKLLLSYSVFTGSGPDFTSFSDICRASAISASVSGYIGLALLFAVFSSAFIPKQSG